MSHPHSVPFQLEIYFLVVDRIVHIQRLERREEEEMGILVFVEEEVDYFVGRRVLLLLMNEEGVFLVDHREDVDMDLYSFSSTGLVRIRMQEAEVKLSKRWKTFLSLWTLSMVLCHLLSLILVPGQ